MFSLKIILSAAIIGAICSSGANGTTTNTKPDSYSNAKEPEMVQGELIVKFHPGIAAEDQSVLLAKMGATIRYRFSNIETMLLSVPTYIGISNLLELSKWIQSQPGVAFAEPNYIVHALESNIVPSDPLFTDLWALQNTESTQIPSPDIGAINAWKKSTGSKNVVVAVIDTGVDYNHEDIKDNYWSNPGEIGLDSQGRNKSNNGVDDDGNGFVDDWRGWDFANNDNNPMDDNMHGTHCAGTIGASGNNKLGVVGVNWHVSIVGLKFLKADGSGETSGAIKAIEYATNMSIPILSNSWGGAPYSEALKEAIFKASQKDILFVAAAGNNSNDIDLRPSYPASYNLPNVLSVAATDSNDAVAQFSNYGKKTVHIAAPGVDILSTVPNNKYEKLSGTSMATPHVAGAAALIKSVFTTAGAKTLKAKILSSVDIIESLNNKTTTHGRLNVGNALENDTTPPSSPSGISVTKQGGTMAQLSWDASGDDDDVGRARSYEIRISNKPIKTDSAWNAATIPKQTIEFSQDDDTISATVFDLPFSYHGWFAVRAYDNVALASPISESISLSTIPVASGMWR